MDNLATHKNSEQVKRSRTKIAVPKLLSYQEVEIDTPEAEKNLNAAFDILFEEMFKINSTSGNIEQLGV